MENDQAAYLPATDCNLLAYYLCNITAAAIYPGRTLESTAVVFAPDRRYFPKFTKRHNY